MLQANASVIWWITSKLGNQNILCEKLAHNAMNILFNPFKQLCVIALRKLMHRKTQFKLNHVQIHADIVSADYVSN